MTAQPVPQSKLTPEVIEAIETSLRVNPSWGAAADYASITDKSLKRYRDRAEAHQHRRDTETGLSEVSLETDPDYPYWQAHQRWLTARSRGELELVAKIRQIGMDGDWRALQALAKAGWPERYNDRIEVTGAGGGPIEVSVEELGRRAEEALERARSRTAERDESADAAPAGNGE